MGSAKQARFVEAIRTMQQNKAGPGTSEYLRIASYHGGLDNFKDYPSYCVHQRESFPGWHRAYLVEFERTLRKADMANGGDGEMGLPYWDWQERAALPPVVRQQLLSDFPTDFWPAGFRGLPFKLSQTNLDHDIQAHFAAVGIKDGAEQCLHSLQHRAHASYPRQSRYPPLEEPHNHVHVAVGGIMGQNYSAFHPAFWLHHCNVDRIYERYLRYQPDSHSEMQRRRSQRTAATRSLPGGLDYGDYRPFINHTTNQPFHARDTFDAQALGFKYVNHTLKHRSRFQNGAKKDVI